MNKYFFNCDFFQPSHAENGDESPTDAGSCPKLCFELFLQAVTYKYVGARGCGERERVRMRGVGR